MNLSSLTKLNKQKPSTGLDSTPFELLRNNGLGRKVVTLINEWYGDNPSMVVNLSELKEGSPILNGNYFYVLAVDQALRSVGRTDLQTIKFYELNTLLKAEGFLAHLQNVVPSVWFDIAFGFFLGRENKTNTRYAKHLMKQMSIEERDLPAIVTEPTLSRDVQFPGQLRLDYKAEDSVILPATVLQGEQFVTDSARSIDSVLSERKGLEVPGRKTRVPLTIYPPRFGFGYAYCGIGCRNGATPSLGVRTYITSKSMSGPVVLVNQT